MAVECGCVGCMKQWVLMDWVGLWLCGLQNGVHYFFTAKEKFEKGIAEGRFLEYANVHGNFYGTSKDAVNDVLNSDKCCILDIDVQGARQVRQSGIRAVFVFIAPPSDEELEKRLKDRGTDSDEQIEKRLRAARIEINRQAPRE